MAESVKINLWDKALSPQITGHKDYSMAALIFSDFVCYTAFFVICTYTRLYAPL